MIVTYKDFVLLLLQLPVCYIFIGLLSKKITPELRQHFKIGILIKLAACVILGLVYLYYYQAGDTLSYFSNSKMVTNEILSHPGNTFKYLFSSEDDFSRYFNSYLDPSISYYYNTPNLTLIKIAAVCNFVSLSSFFGTGFIFCFFSYLGLWKLFLVFYRSYPDIGKKFVLILYIPSVVFWGSGILKDSFCLGCIGIVIYLVNGLHSLSIKSAIKLLIVGICLYLIWLIKPYIFFCLIIPLVIWRYSFYLIRLRKRLSIKTIVMINVVVFLFVYKFAHITERLNAISLEDMYLEILKTRAGFIGDDDGSSFSLGEFTPTVWGFIQQIPSAVTAVLFRPYVWESKKIFSLIAAGESLLILSSTILVIAKAHVKTTIKNVLRNPDILFCFFFTLLFAIALGISVSNFGALVRFKIQFLPFFVIGLLLIYYRKGTRTVTDNSETTIDQ